MSVLKNKRDLSDMEFYKNAIRMNQELVTWMMRNFGTERNPRSVNQVIKNISEDDQKAIDDIFSKYGQSPNHEFVSEFPKWYIDRKRKRLLDLCDELIENITNANSIYPTEEFLHEEYAMRREFQTMAICNCKDIEQVLQGIRVDFRIDINKLDKFFDMSKREVDLLKGWRQSDNKARKDIEKKIEAEKKKELEGE
jgi:hypothetical protein